MEPTELVTAAFIMLILLMFAGYLYSRNNSTEVPSQKLVEDTDVSEATESEPELEVKEKAVEKMAMIVEEPELEKESKTNDEDESDSEEYRFDSW